MDHLHKGEPHLQSFQPISAHYSLGVEPVDDDIMKRPPRRVKEPMLTISLLLQVMCSAAIIVSGTLWIFWREVSILWGLCNRIPSNKCHGNRLYIWFSSKTKTNYLFIAVLVKDNGFGMSPVIIIQYMYIINHTSYTPTGAG